MKRQIIISSVVMISLIAWAFSQVVSKPVYNWTIVKSLPGYDGDLPFILETGYIGVSKSEDIQLFYYFIESERDVERDPLILWLTGGPGCSGFSGLVLEIGPLWFNYTAYTSSSQLPQFQLNPYSWTKVASIIFLDSPPGTGFSYSTNPESYYSDDTIQSLYVYEFLKKPHVAAGFWTYLPFVWTYLSYIKEWLIDHPKFIRSPFYIAGDSYSGTTVPLILQQILDENENDSSLHINVRGYILGNPRVKSDVQNTRYAYANMVSIVPDEVYESIIKNCRGDFVVDEQTVECTDALNAADKDMEVVNIAYVLEPRCVYVSPKPRTKSRALKNMEDDPVDFRWKKFGVEKLCRNYRYLLTQYWSNDKRVQEALNVRQGKIDSWVRCNTTIAYTESSGSATGFYQNFTKKIMRSLVYSGDQDMAVPYIDTLGWIEKLDVPIDLKWRPWFVDGQVAGYAVDYSNNHFRLTYATIKGGGHTAPEFKPRESFAMLERWLSLRYL